MKKWIAVYFEGALNNNAFGNKTFESYEEGWDYIYCKVPVIENEDGTQDDREDELDLFTVIPI